MARSVSVVLVAQLLLLATLASASLHRGLVGDHHHRAPAMPVHNPQVRRAPGDEGKFGSYVVTCSGSSLSFLNFDSQDCTGDFSSYTGGVGQCGVEPFPILLRNFSYNALCNATHAWYNNFPTSDCSGASMLSRFYTLGGCNQCPNKICKNGNEAPEEVFGALASGLPWIENQWHVAPGVALVTSMNSGTIYQLTYNASEDCVRCASTLTQWITGLKSVSGIAVNARTKTAFALAVVHDMAGGGVERNILIKFSTEVPNAYTAIATMPDELQLFGNLTLNGLAIHGFEEGVFYATDLGNFTAGAGRIILIDARRNDTAAKVTVVASNLTGADGAFFNDGKLYVSEVFAGRVHVYDTSRDPTNLTEVASYVPPGVTSLDDFFVHNEGMDGRVIMVGADWAAGRIASWPANGTSNASDVMIHAAGLTHPTSVRPEMDFFRSARRGGGDHRGQYVTVTQGGAYPAIGTAANGGAVYRLRVGGPAPRVYSPGAVIELSFTNSDCTSPTLTGQNFQIDTCLPASDLTSSTRYHCAGLAVERKTFNGTKCEGEPVSKQNTTILKCNADGATSSIELCVSLEQS